MAGFRLNLTTGDRVSLVGAGDGVDQATGQETLDKINADAQLAATIAGAEGLAPGLGQLRSGTIILAGQTALGTQAAVLARDLSDLGERGVSPERATALLGDGLSALGDITTIGEGVADALGAQPIAEILGTTGVVTGAFGVAVNQLYSIEDELSRSAAPGDQNYSGTLAVEELSPAVEIPNLASGELTQIAPASTLDAGPFNQLMESGGVTTIDQYLNSLGAAPSLASSPPSLGYSEPTSSLAQLSGDEEPSAIDGSSVPGFSVGTFDGTSNFGSLTNLQQLDPGTLDAIDAGIDAAAGQSGSGDIGSVNDYSFAPAGGVAFPQETPVPTDQSDDSIIITPVNPNSINDLNPAESDTGSSPYDFAPISSSAGPAPVFTTSPPPSDQQQSDNSGDAGSDQYAGGDFDDGDDFGGDFGGGYGYAPVVLDLSGKGVNITQLSSSNTYFDLTGDGKENKTAWAGAGNGVLFYDPTGTGQLTQADQIDFTDWDPGSTSDLQALEDVFDTNHDGSLDAGDADFADFYVMVTNANGAETAYSLAELGITSINHERGAIAA